MIVSLLDKLLAWWRPPVTRFEVIDHRRAAVSGRAYVARPCRIEMSYQDQGRTLKVFVEDAPPQREHPMDVKRDALAARLLASAEGAGRHASARDAEPSTDWLAARTKPLPCLEIPICAALQLEDGRVIRGHRHDDCIQTVLKWKKAGQDVGFYKPGAQGFYTSHERFVSREEGARLWREAGRLSAHLGRPFTGDLLFSEDLY